MNDYPLPVAIDVAEPGLAGDLTRHVEGHLGWQVVEDCPDLPAKLVLRDRPDPDPRAVLVATDLDGELLRAAVEAGAGRVIQWPAEAARLADLLPGNEPAVPVRRLVVGGAAGGVGTTTVAVVLAVGCAHTGRPTWLIAGAAARRMAGIDPEDSGVVECRPVPALRFASRPADVAAAAAPGDVVVVDAGARPDSTLLVARPDGALLAALDGGHGGPVLTVGEGALRPAEVARAVGGRPHAHLAHSRHLARAALAGRLPGLVRRSTLDTVTRVIRLGRERRIA